MKSLDNKHKVFEKEGTLHDSFNAFWINIYHRDRRKKRKKKKMRISLNIFDNENVSDKSKSLKLQPYQKVCIWTKLQGWHGVGWWFSKNTIQTNRSKDHSSHICSNEIKRGLWTISIDLSVVWRLYNSILYSLNKTFTRFHAENCESWFFVWEVIMM